MVFIADCRVLVYFWALPSDSGPRLSGNGGEGRGGQGRGGRLGADCGVISDPRSHQLPVTEGRGEGGSHLPLLCCPKPEGLS